MDAREKGARTDLYEGRVYVDAPDCRAAESSSAMAYREYAPGPALAPYVECFWIACSDARPSSSLPREILLPDGTTQLMLNFGAPYRRFADSEANRGINVGKSHLMGPRRTGVFIEQEGRERVFAVRFRPGGFYPFVSIPMSELVHQSIDLELLPGAFQDGLESLVFEARSPEEQVRIAERALLRRLHRNEAVERQIHRLVGTIYATRGSITIDRLGQELGWGYKALDRAFARYVGLSPKALCRIVRFNYAVSLIYRFENTSLTSVAHEAGYSDQAHMIRDFKEFTGASPREFLRRRYRIVEAIQPALRARLSNSFNF